ncbi:MAG TPA: hypothetical protein PKW33_04990 [Anaerolineaceae bacterium]|nr:hypothetical protein [Anaerolineaceae bacterium]HPN50919.1 hypothetical protein [Anaerolineaceae bacterium]
MHTWTARLIEIWEENGARVGLLECPADHRPSAGRCLLGAAREGPPPVLPHLLFPGGLLPEGLVLAPGLPLSWQPGIELALRGPFGSGFHLPPKARHVLLAAPQHSPRRLLPLIPLALAQRSEVTLVCHPDFLAALSHPLPPLVEAIPPEALPEALDWADYLAADCPAGLPHLLTEWRGSGQALISVPMPCGNLADCGACAVNTRGGWKLACKDGPVFDLRDLA